MAASAVITVAIPDSDTRAIEVAWVEQALRLALHAIRSPGGAVTSGDLTYIGKNLGSWVYTPQAGV